MVKRQLAQNAIILMDDVERPDERGIIERWEKQFNVSCGEHHTTSGAYAIVKAIRGAA
jgi:beta-lactamase superfamily II metal-dependent hydrolase